MNFLAHLLLAGDNPELLVGNLMGDFVKGRLEDRFPPGISRGIDMHRRIDTFAGNSDIFRQSKRRIDPAFGLYRGVLVDLFYDHFLAVSWDDYSPVPFEPFLRDAHATVRKYGRFLPERLRSLVPVIFDELLPSYTEVEGIDRALARMARRVGRPNPLADGGRELRRHFAQLRGDFRSFFPQVAAFAAEYITNP
jgi:acyl carrier protein phosphodiesterase